jgi:DNA-binding MarR family transcriptional regulator
MAKDKSGKRAAASVGHLLHRAAQRALDLYAAQAGPGAVTQRQHAVLAAVAEKEGAAQADLVASTGIDRSTLADMVARMIDKGLLARERSALDARANAVRLTDAGREALLEALEILASGEAREKKAKAPKADKPAKAEKKAKKKKEKLAKAA